MFYGHVWPITERSMQWDGSPTIPISLLSWHISGKGEISVYKHCLAWSGQEMFPRRKSKASLKQPELCYDFHDSLPTFKKIFLTIFFNCLGIKMYILMLYIKIFFFYLKAHFILLILKEIKIFSWAPRSTMGPRHYVNLLNRCRPQKHLRHCSIW